MVASLQRRHQRLYFFIRECFINIYSLLIIIFCNNWVWNSESKPKSIKTCKNH